MTAPTLYDVLILGGGPAGLAAAQALARQMWTAVVFSDGVYRNARATHMHNVLGWDHTPPAEFRAKARADIEARYSTITFQDDTTIAHLTKLENGRFEARNGAGATWRGRTVIIATGITDVPPPIDGYAAAWGRGIVHCLFCHGYEERGAAHAGVLAVGDLASVPAAGHIARMARRLAERVIIFTHGNAELAAAIDDHLAGVTDIRADARPIVGITQVESGVSLAFDEGSEKLAFLAHRPAVRLNGDFAGQLGCALTSTGLYQVGTPIPQTSVPGVFAAGDNAHAMGAVPTAAFLGAAAAAGAIFHLLADPF